MIYRLPALHAFARLDGPGARRRGVPLAGDTLSIDAERALATVVFRGSLPIDRHLSADALAEGAYSIRAGLAPCEDVEASLAEPRAWSAFSPRAAAPAPRAHAPSPTVDPVTLQNDSGFTASTLAWAPDPKTSRRAILVKATFDIPEDGGPLTLAKKQDDLHGDVHAPEGEKPELLRASDFVPLKLRADVLLRGTAHAAPGAAAALVTLYLGALRARVVALPPRAFGPDGVPRQTGPFAPVPLTLSRAFGGFAFAANPAGTGMADGSAPPLLEDPDRLLRTRADRPRPAAFAPISPQWDARRSLLGTFDAAWQRDRWPCLPANLDPAYFQAAPPELRCPHLAGDEPFRIEHVRPGGRGVEGALPGRRPRAFVLRDGHDPAEVLLYLDTVVFDTDALKVSLTFRGSFTLAGPVRVALLADDARSPRPVEEIAALLCARAFPALAEPGAAPLPKARSYALADVLRPSPTPPNPPSPSARSRAARPAFALAIATGTGVFAAAAREAAAAPPPPPLPPPPSRAEVEAMLAKGADLRKVDLSGADLSGIDLSGRDLEGALLAGARLEGARLARANLTGANLAGIHAPSSVWDDADLTRADLTGATLTAASLQCAKLDQTKLTSAHLDDAHLEGAEGETTSFVRASLARAHLTTARIPKADLSYASAPKAHFDRAVLDDAKLLETDAAGAVFDESSLADARFEKAALASASLLSSKAAGAVFEQADLTSAVLRKADLTSAVLAGALLPGADLRAVLARGAVFREAVLEDARLDGADLMQATFESAHMRRASLTGANLYQAETWKADTTQANLEGAHLAGTKLATPQAAARR
ncbi:MAG: DUF2169 domain-containing protein [Polyangiaceae bacterium]